MDVTVGRFLRFVIILFFIVIIGWLMYKLADLLTVVIVSFLIAYILDPVASFMEAKGLSRSNATTIIFLVFFMIIALNVWLVLPGVFSQLFVLQKQLTSGGTDNLILALQDFIKSSAGAIDVESIDIKGKLESFMTTVSGEVMVILSNIGSIVSAVAIIPFVVFFFLRDGRNMKKVFISYVPNRYFEITLNIMHKIDGQLGGYLRGQFTEATVVGVLGTIALVILNVKYSIIIGIFAGLANMIPYVGPVAGAVPAILVTLVNGGSMATIIYIVIAFAIVQFIDNMIVQPIVLSKSVDLHPLIIVFAVLIGGKFFGLLGLLLAVPAAGMIKVTSSEIYYGIKKFRHL
jgi:predicted PurR-regulated permease PerM